MPQVKFVDIIFSGNIPEFTRQLRDQTGMDGDSVLFQCHVVGHPTPEVRWLKDGDVIKKHKVCYLTFNTIFIHFTVIPGQ